MRPDTRLHVGLPKGRFLSHVREALVRMGVALEPDMVQADLSPGVRLHLVKARDTPRLVRDGYLDLGVASDEWIVEAISGVERLGRLCWCHTTVCLIAPPGRRTPKRGAKVTIATEYPTLVNHVAAQRGWDATIMTVHGSTEAYVPDIADYVVDCVESGRTIRANGLAIVEPLYRSDMHVIGRPTFVRTPGVGKLGTVLDALLASAFQHESVPFGPLDDLADDLEPTPSPM